MKIIELDASDWITSLDFYDALLGLLKAPDWHGRSINALIDSMIYGEINEVEPPLLVRVTHLSKAGFEARSELELALVALNDAGANCQIDSDGVALIQVGETVH